MTFNSKRRTRKSHLSAHVVDGRLVISIGVETLAFAFDHSEFAQPHDDESGEFVQAFKVTSPVMFARAVARELEREQEDGTTPVHLLLDAACAGAVEDGCEGVEEGSGPALGAQ